MGRQQRNARMTNNASTSPQHHHKPQPGADDELDLQSFSESLYPIGLAIRDVADDGNCFFRAVSDQLYGSEQYHDTLRQRACDYLMRHKQTYQYFIDDEQQPFDEYVMDMRNNGVWADNLELQAISMACKVNIRIHQSGPGHPSYDIRNHPAPDAPVIHLSYHFGEHYASVRPLRTLNLNVPAQHASLPVNNNNNNNNSNHLNSTASITNSNTSAITSSITNNSMLTTSSLTNNNSNSNNSDHHTTAINNNNSNPLRRPRRNPISSSANNPNEWTNFQESHAELCRVAERTRRLAKATRISEQGKKQADNVQAARMIERNMKELNYKLDRIGQTIVHHMNNPLLFQDEYNTKKLKQQMDALHTALVESGDAVNQAREDVQALERKIQSENYHFTSDNNRQHNIEQHHEHQHQQYVEHQQQNEKDQRKRHLRGNKKREQENKKKERKDRRRREQERVARGGLDLDDLAVRLPPTKDVTAI